jgi:hypothetical protein
LPTTHGQTRNFFVGIARKAIDRVVTKLPLTKTDVVPASASAVKATCIHVLLLYATSAGKSKQQPFVETPSTLSLGTPCQNIK